MDRTLHSSKPLARSADAVQLTPGTVTDNVGSEDRGQPALYALFAHGTPLAGVIAA